MFSSICQVFMSTNEVRSQLHFAVTDFEICTQRVVAATSVGTADMLYALERQRASRVADASCKCNA